MSNKLRKELESELISVIEGKLADLNKKATLNSKKSIKKLSKDLAKKFYKEVKKSDKRKTIPKTKTKSKARSKARPGRPRKAARP